MIAPLLAALVLCGPAPALARPQLAGIVATAAPASPGAVLGLDSADPAVAELLTTELRRAAQARGVSGGGPGSDTPLAELRLTMGCDGDDPACLAEGGKAIGLATLVYGRLRPLGDAGERYQVQLSLLDVGTGTVQRSVSAEFDATAFTAETVASTADNVIAQLFGDPSAEPAAAVVPAATPAATPVAADGPTAAAQPAPVTDAEPAAPAQGRLVWGKADPTPRWKPIALWTSVGLAGASVITAGVSTWAISGDGPVRDDLLAEAEASTTDTNPGNDVDPNTSGDLCALARAQPAGEPGTVTNSDMVRICNRADALATTATATWITTGVFAASAVAFTLLTYLHREPAGTTSARRHRGLRRSAAARPSWQLGLAPSVGGWVVGASGRF